MSIMTTETINRIFANTRPYAAIYFHIYTPTGRYTHPKYLMQSSAEQMLKAGYKLYLI